ncbi:MAG: hypothetical protein HY040_28275 [Planctomycetes bacterium]|nr:hypothetical protein [Planctomycetota bacterium]
MVNHEQFREQILPYLYDLLDRQERLRFEAHLEEHPELRNDVEAMRQKKSLITRVAKEEFAEVKFQPPVSAKSQRHAAAPTVAFPTPPERRDRRTKVRWAAAAAIAFLIFGGGAAFSVYGWNKHKNSVVLAQNQLNTANQAVFDLQKKLENENRQAQNEIRDIQTQIDNLVGEWKRETADAKRIHEDKQTQVIISGPKNLQAGATNKFQIQVRPKAQAPKAKPALMARVVNTATKQVLFQEKLVCDYGAPVILELPPSLPIKPGEPLALELQGQTGDGVPIEVREHLKLVSPEYLTHLVTDRPMYRPGEFVRFRSLTLDRFSLKPTQEDMKLRFTVTGPNNVQIFQTEGRSELVSEPKKEPLSGPDGNALKGIGAGEFQLPADLPGGQYMLTVSEASDRFPAEARGFLVNRWQVPLFNKELNFHRSAYGPGEKVVVRGRVTRLDGSLANLGLELQAFVDGMNIQMPIPFHNTDEDGAFEFQFQLPKEIKRGDGSVTLKINDNNNVESLVRPIPMLLKKLLVDFYPEGGDLVAGVANRVYFEVHTPTGKPADLQGQVVDQANVVVAKIQTITDDMEPGLNQGLGVFEFIPMVDKKYRLQIDTPAGVNGSFFLPSAKSDGVVLRLPKGVVENSIEVSLTSSEKDRELLVGAYCRGRLLDFSQVKVQAGKTKELTLRPALEVGGVYRITAFEKIAGDKYRPIAERLIFRRSPEHLSFSIAADKQSYYPGEKVQLALQSTNEKREISPAILLVSVVDVSVGRLANDKTIRAMPTHFLLTSEVRRSEDLENADFFMGSHPKADLGLDLLLGVQGWRRFAEQDPARFARMENADEKKDAVRFLQAVAPGGTQTTDPEKDLVAVVDGKYAPRFVGLQEKLGGVEKIQLDAPQRQMRLQQENVFVQTTRGQLESADQRLRAFERWLAQVFIGVTVIVILFAGLFSLYFGMRRMARGKSAIGFFATGGTILVLLFMGSLAATIDLMRGRGFGDAPFAEFAQKPVGMARAVPPMAAVAEAPLPDMGDENKLNGFPAKGLPMEPAFAPAAPIAPAQPKVHASGADAEEVDVGPGFAPKALGAAKGDPANLRGGEIAGRRLPDNHRKLRREGNFQQLLQASIGRKVPLPENTRPFVVREYAHRHQPAADNNRVDFTETVCWRPALVLADGKCDISFDLSDSTTKFQVMVVGHTLDGRIGASSLEFASTLPYSIEPRIPEEIAATDTVIVPVAVTNNTDRPASVELTTWSQALAFQNAPMPPLSLSAKEKARQLLTFTAQPAGNVGAIQNTPSARRGAISVHGKFAPAGFDSVTRSLNIVPEGFPILVSHSGLLEGNAAKGGSVQHEFSLPDTWVLGSLECRAQIFPSTLAELQKGLEGLLREPCGCFEQSSTSNYPNVLILNYLKESKQSNDGAETQARRLLESGYRKLTSFECFDPRDQAKRQGYEWFGQAAPPHEALTAYGLLQFKDMSKVYPVDKAMLERTTNYLLDARDGKGGFKRNPRAVDSFGRAPDHITNAYITWALTESGVEEKVGAELKALFDQAKTSKDAYFVALAGLSHLNRGQAKEGLELLKNLRGAQAVDGHLTGAATSITGSAGRDLEIETTALGVLGWLRANRPEEFHQNIDKAVKWLGKQRGGHGAFGSTQSTILALKALIAFTQDRRKAVQPGEVQLVVNELPIQGAKRNLTGDMSEPVTLSLPPNSGMSPGNNKVRIEMTGANSLPYTLSISYRTQKPANPENCPVHVNASLNKTELKQGDAARLSVSLSNRTGKGQGMTVAIIGLPAGLAFSEDMAQLKELARVREEDGKFKPGVISAWELKGRELVLYWRDLAPKAEIIVRLDLVARFPGSYTGPASRAYLYYNADNKYWIDPLHVNVAP